MQYFYEICFFKNKTQQTNFFGVDSSVPKMCQAHNIEEKTSSRKEGGRVSLEHFLLVCMLTCKAAKFTAKRGSELNLEFWIGG